MTGGGAKGEGGSLGDLACGAPPHEGYGTAPPERHETAQRSGRDGDANSREERDALSERDPTAVTALMRFGVGAACSTALRKCWG